MSKPTTEDIENFYSQQHAAQGPPQNPYQPPTPGGLPPQRPGPFRRHPILTGIAAAVVLIVAVTIGALALISNAANQALNPNSVKTQPPVSSQPAQPSTPETPQPPPGPTTDAVGTTAIITQDGQDAAHITITRVSVSTQPADPSFMSQPENGYYVTAHVKVEILPGYTGSSFDVYSGDFYALSGGQHYDEGDGNAYEAPGNGKELDFTNLNAGETATGTLVFDLPRPHGKIAYAPNYEGGPLCYWKF